MRCRRCGCRTRSGRRRPRSRAASRCGCSPSAPRPSGRGSSSTSPTRARSRRSPDGSTACLSRSSSRPRGSSCCRPTRCSRGWSTRCPCWSAGPVTCRSVSRPCGPRSPGATNCSAAAPGACWPPARYSAAASASRTPSPSARRPSTWAWRSWTDWRNWSTRACCADWRRPATRVRDAVHGPRVRGRTAGRDAGAGRD